MAITSLQIHNSIIDNKLLKLSNETIPLNAISSISVSHKSPFMSFMVFLGCGYLAILFAISESIVLAGICLFICLCGLIMGLNPKFFLLINLHSGRTIRLHVGNQRQARQAEADLQNALLRNPFVDIAQPQLGRG